MVRTGYRQGNRNLLQSSLLLRLGLKALSLLLFLFRQIGRAVYTSLFLVLKYAFLGLIFVGRQSFKGIHRFPRLSRPRIQLGKVALPTFPKVRFRLPTPPSFPSHRLTLAFLPFRFRLKFPKKISLALVLLLLIGSSLYVFIIKDLPSPRQLTTKEPIVATRIYDRHGTLLYTLYNGDQRRTLVALDQIPPHVINATIAVEDQTYWQHPGFSLRGIVRALRRNLAHQSVQGGSTITQQLVKNSLLTSERTLIRKIKEVLLAVQVELIYSKKEILQMYFNEIPYGGTAYGIAEAAQIYFGKSVQDLNLAEAALLAGLPAAPTKYSPFGANPQLAYLRQHQVLERMVEDGYITQTQANEAGRTKLTLQPPREEIRAPHFVMYVKDLLVEKYGTKRVEQGGLEVTTSLDLTTQQLAEEQLQQELNRLTQLHVTNGAVLVTQPTTGEILAMVGSKDYFDTANDGNVNVITQLRQPGSAIKPVNYAVALQSGFTPSTIIQDTPVAFQSLGSPPYAPVNYDGQFHGPITLRTALASSFNVPAVKVLATYGVDRMINQGQALGITSWKDRDRFGLSLTLGGGEVRMTDMAVVYGTFANQGLRVDLNPILQVNDYRGKSLYTFSCDPRFNLLPQVEAAQEKDLCNPQSVLNPLIAYQLTDILADNLARAPAFGVNSLLQIPGHQVAVKTGTTNDKRDNWTIGYTQDYVVAVWVGNNDNSPMSQVASGITGASPIWHAIMKSLLDAQGKPHVFQTPAGLEPFTVCRTSGTLPCGNCVTQTEYFLPGTLPTQSCPPPSSPSPQP
jgi:1A family penicillin-binding protein